MPIAFTDATTQLKDFKDPSVSANCDEIANAFHLRKGFRVVFSFCILFGHSL